MLVVLIGGAGSVAGPLVGAAIVVLLPEALAGLAEYRLLFFGALLLAVLWLAPDGVVGAVPPAHRPAPRSACPLRLQLGSTSVPQSAHGGSRRRAWESRSAACAPSTTFPSSRGPAR